MPERAEIEAVARALLHKGIGSWDEQSELRRKQAEKAIEALDRVRDARGDDEDEGPKWLSMDDLSYKGGGVMGRRPARSPQGEDHEAGIEAAEMAWLRKAPPETIRAGLERAIGAYLSRVSPSRDGTVAVEDVAAFLRATVMCGSGEFFAMRVEREFGSARGESKQHADGG